MSALPDHGVPEERSSGANDPDSLESVPEWAPPEPLPSSEMFLAVFSGLRPVTAGDSLHPAYDLVECQREHRQAVEVFGAPNESYAQLKAAAAALVTAHADIEVLITIIDDAVADRLKHRRSESEESPTPIRAPLDRLPAVPMHTESIGEIVARMADLWEQSVAKATELTCDTPAETHQLVELCAGYDCLAAEIESGRRLLPGM
ncbi:hypothetical protein ACFZC5_32850 [Nocardia gamkensis]|uniref:hypothetical protein n=1 Tax=Nocardia gamkensis TaxID=352869 RepID=UPI0036EA03D2